MKEGDLVYPSKINTIKFNKNAVFPWRVHKVDGLTLTLGRTSKAGKIRFEKWYIGFWQIYPSEVKKAKEAV